MILSRYFHWAVLLAVVLSGCAQIPPRAVEAWTAPAWEDWNMRGRVAVRAADQGWHANLSWRQTGEAFQMELSGPLGQGAIRLHGDAARVQLERADGLRDQAADADALLARHTGWSLPVSGLRYWVRGLAVPARPAHWVRAPDGRPERLQQDGWDIRYTDFRDQPGLGLLPRRIDLERDGLQARLLIDTWTPG